MNNLLSVVALHEESETSKLGCDICDSGDPPANRCTTCSHFLCEICTQAHQRARNTKSHNLVSLEEAKKMGSAAVTKPAVCKEHDGEVMKLFCDTCEEAICRDCTIVKHRNHKYTFVKDAFSKGKKSLLKTLADTKGKADVLEKAVKGVLEMKKIVHSRADQTIEEVVECCNELTGCIAARSTYLIDRVEEFKKAKLKSLDTQQEQLETALASVQSSVQFTEKAFENGSEVEILNMRKQMSSRLQDLNSARWQLEPCVNETLGFTGNGQLKDSIASFGVVSDVVTDAGMSTVTMENAPEGVMYSSLCGQPVKFSIIAKDCNGRMRKEGGDIFNTFVQSVCLPGAQIKEIPVKDSRNGTYSFCHTAMKTGIFELTVKLKGSHVRGSPFRWSVGDWKLQEFSYDNSVGELILSDDKLTAKYNLESPNLRVYNSVNDYFKLQEHVNDRRLYAVGMVNLTNSMNFMWKIQIHSETFQGFSFGVVNVLFRNGKLVKLGSKWVWSSKNKQFPSSFGNLKVVKSSITDCKSGDIIELYLDCESERLRMQNLRTKQSDTWDGVRGAVSPVFHLANNGDKVSLMLPN